MMKKIQYFAFYLLLIFAPTYVLAAEKIIGISLGDTQSRPFEEISALKASIEGSGNRFIILDAQASSSKQVDDIVKLIELGVDALVVRPQDSRTLVDVVNTASLKGIPVISYEVPIENTSALYVAYDLEEVGRIQARGALEIAPKGNYVFMNGNIIDISTELLIRGRQEILDQAISQGKVKIIGETYLDSWKPENAQRNMEQILTANSNNVDAVLVANDGAATGVAAAFVAEGLVGVPLSGQGGDEATLNRIARGTQTVSVWTDAGELGKQVAKISGSLADGLELSEMPGVELRSIDTAYGKLSAALLQPFAITKDNLNVAIDAGWIEPDVLCQGVSYAEATVCRSVKTNLPYMDVCFGSDRAKQTNRGSRARFSYGRALGVELGFARVSIPEDIHEFGNVERPVERKYWFLNFGKEAEDATKHFVIQQAEILSEDELVERSQQILSKSSIFSGHAIVYIHGFNVSFDEALYSAAQISWDIGFDGLSCIYSWPSKGELSFTGYTYDNNSALQARNYLADFLELISKIEGAENISIIAHSMGNVALLEALRTMPSPPENSRKLFSQIIMAAPDIDRDNFVSLSAVLPKFGNGVTLYASSNDRALEASKRLAASISRAGDVPDIGPIVMPLIDSIDASAVSSYVFGLNHSYFANDRSVVADIGRLISKGERPPNIRTSTLRIVEKEIGKKYWKFPD